MHENASVDDITIPHAVPHSGSISTPIRHRRTFGLLPRVSAYETLLVMESRFPLLAAFSIGRGAVVSIAGGGGKTSLMFALARTFLAEGRRVITTTTTRIYPPTEEQSPHLVLLEESVDPIAAVRDALAAAGHVTVGHQRNSNNKIGAISPALVDALAAAKLADVIIVEADGAAGRPIKAARDGEPVFPPSSTHCLFVAGVEAIGAPLDEVHVFRSALAGEILGLPSGATLSAEAVADLLLGPRGLASRSPEESVIQIFVNKAESPEQVQSAYELARATFALRPGRLPERVVVGSLMRVDAGFFVLER